MSGSGGAVVVALARRVRMVIALVVVAAVTIAFGASRAQAATEDPRPDQLAFRALYEELVETNTTLSEGSCTLAAERMGARLLAAGYPAEPMLAAA